MMSKPESEAKIAAMFDKVAPRYDFLNSLLSAGQDRRWRRQLVSWIGETASSSLLDVATGTGDVILAIAQTYPHISRLCGVDISQHMLTLGLEKAKERQLENSIAFHKMSAEKLAFPDKHFDCLTIAFGLRNVIHKEAALREFYRLLSQQGHLFILEFFSPQHSLLASLFQFYFHAVLPKVGALFSDREAYHYLPKSVENFYTFTELRQALDAQGFKWQRHKAYLGGACQLIHVRK